MKGYEEFKEALKQRESKGDYGIVNKFGFLGAYQFGRPRLYDLRISIDGWHPKGEPVMRFVSMNEFLNDKNLQDDLFKAHVKDYAASILVRFSDYFGKVIHGAEVTLSGCVAAVHLQGFGNKKDPGLTQFLQSKIDDADGLGTTISEYMKTFAGYNLEKIT